MKQSVARLPGFTASVVRYLRGTDLPSNKKSGKQTSTKGPLLAWMKTHRLHRQSVAVHSRSDGLLISLSPSPLNLKSKPGRRKSRHVSGLAVCCCNCSLPESSAAAVRDESDERAREWVVRFVDRRRIHGAVEGRKRKKGSQFFLEFFII